MPSDVWYAIPSANIDLARETLPAWRDMGYRVAVMIDAGAPEPPADRVIRRDSYPGWAASVNLLCRDVAPSDTDIVVSGGDDMLPDPSKRAHEIADEFREHFPDGFGVMQPHGDDFERTRSFCGSPWLGRAWIDRAYAGLGPMPPMYFHDYADTELYWVARGLGALWERPDLVQRHEHFSRRGEAPPEFWQRSVGATQASDALIFHARSRAGFPGHAPLDQKRPLDRTAIRPALEIDLPKEVLDANGLRVEFGVGATRMRDALLYCDTMGHRRIGIYGAGRHTRAAGFALADPPVEIVCIIDDDPAATPTLWGLPVRRLEEAMSLNLDAVILSSDAHEAALAQQASPLADHGVEVIGLYGQSSPAAA
ncbi:MAG: hypothetical protein AAGK04_11550 [Planctomycetota bacterium]